MTLDARRIALQGFGSTALAIALQGFTPAPAVAAPPPPAFYGGGGALYHDWRAELAEQAEAHRIKAQNDAILAALMAAFSEGLLE